MAWKEAKPPPWRCSNNDRSRSPCQSKRHCNPCHPLRAFGPHPTQALPSCVRDEMARLKSEAWFRGDKIKPWNEDWFLEYHRRSVEIMKRLCNEPNSGNLLWQRMPRNPATKRYEQHLDLGSKAKFLKCLLNLYTGEVRETKETSWIKVHAPLPSDVKWKHPQYDANSFLWKGCHKDEHWQRPAEGLTLPRMLDLYRNMFTAEVIFETYLSLPIVVDKKKRAPKRRAA